MSLIGQRIKRIRISCKITQDELAERLQVTKQTISNYERGVREPSLDTLAALANAFDVPISDLLSDNFSYNNNEERFLFNQDYPLFAALALHKILTRRRKELGLTLDSLAEKSHVSKSTLAKIMSGATPNPQFETLRSITYALDMSLSDIGYSDNDYFASLLSPAALRVARVYDSLPESGKRSLDAFCDYVEDRG